MSLFRNRVPVRGTQYTSSNFRCLFQPRRACERRSPYFVNIRHATHAAQGRANGPKNRPGRRLGAKKTGDEYVIPGNIIFRQRGTHWFPGENVGMGRDHTIFAKEKGYVKYYRDPNLHQKRRFIGVVFDKTQTLPSPTNAPRRRRLGMIAVPRRDQATVVIDAAGEKHAGNEIGIIDNIAKSGAPLPIAQADSGSNAGLPVASRRETKEARKRRLAGRVPIVDLTMRPNYSYRESNAQIGRAAERAGVKVKEFQKGDRFLAWRLKAARKQRAAEKRAMARKGKKGKPLKK